MRAYQFGEAQRVVHDFLWNEYCDWYIEMSKIRLRSGIEPSPLPVLAHVLEKTLRLLHPFLPFVTEEIWSRLTTALPQVENPPEAAIVAPYPQADSSQYDVEAEREVESVVELVRAARNLRAEFRIDNSQRLSAHLAVANGVSSLFEDALGFIQSQARIDLEVESGQASHQGSSDQAVQVLNAGTLAVSLGGLVDLAEETDRLKSELEDLRKYQARVSKNLMNQNFVNRAPEEVVERERDRLSDTELRIGRLVEILDRLAS
jgi:valyl-tRNA synthetase